VENVNFTKKISRMEQLYIKEIVTDMPVTFSKAENLLEKYSITHSISSLNWNEFPYKPSVNFRIAHVKNEIWLKYYVKEKHILALETKVNGDVYKDSCVEFFISPDKQNYYNFEINCIGTIHLAYGSGRHNRKFVDPALIQKITTSSSLGGRPFEERTGNFEWEIMIRIPVECFAFSKLNTFKGLKATANFYKCGDGTSEPHYISWNPVKTDNPDYHRPEYFGNIYFE
jgi:hypothetical protein